MRIKNFCLVLYRQGQYSKEKLTSLFENLPLSRKERILKLNDNPTYQEFLIVEYFIVAKKLRLSNQQDFCYNKFGKPYTKNEKLHFNISHSKNILAIAFSRYPIGVDVQHFLDCDDDIAKLTCNDEEYAIVLNSKNKNIEFTKLWAQKESVVKMFGGTLYLDTKNILSNIAQLKIKCKVKEDYVISICYSKHLDFDQA